MPTLSFVPADVLSVMKKIHDAGFGVWVVGGALRDLLLGIEPKDWDLATSASAGKIISVFPRVIPVGIRHGTVQVRTRTRDIEVTSFEPSEEAGILKDLRRRDFTINSIALSYPDGHIIDPNRGREDLKAGLVRAVEDPRARFSEDPLRIVRAARICAVYGFKTDTATFEAMRQTVGGLESVSGERVRDEILKILQAGNLSAGFELLKDAGALGKLLPGLMTLDRPETDRLTCENVYEHTVCCLLNCPERVRIRLAALFHVAAPPAELAGSGRRPMDFRSASAHAAAHTMKKWNMSNRSINEVSTLISHQLQPESLSWSDFRIRRFITEVGPKLLEDSLSLAEAEILCAKASAHSAAPVNSKMPAGHSSGWAGHGENKRSGIERVGKLAARMRIQLEAIPAMSVRELALSGDDIMKFLDLKPGPQVGKVLDSLFEMVLADPELNTRDHLTSIVLEKFR
jgi:tRNA nucleotidyltransferase/poly(A) polymerase